MQFKAWLIAVIVNALLLFLSCPGFAEDWQVSMYTALAPLKTLQAPNANCSVQVLMKTEPSGKLQFYSIGQDGPAVPGAVQGVEAMVRKIQATIPPPVPARKYVWFTVFFVNGKAARFGGPSGFDEIPESVQVSVGLKKKSYELLVKDKLPCRELSAFPYGKAKTISKVKLTKSGNIENIRISAPDLVAQKFVYDLIGRSQPFPPPPAQYLKSPNFDIIISWEREADGPMRGSGSFSVKVNHVD